MAAPSIVNQTPFTNRVFINTSTTLVFDAAVTAGNTIAVCVAVRNDSAHDLDDVITGLSMTGVTFVGTPAVVAPLEYDGTRGALFYTGTVTSSGATTVTLTLASGNCYVVGRAFELNGVTAVDVSAVGSTVSNGTNTVTTASTGTLSVADSIVLNSTHADYTGADIDWNTPSTYTAYGEQVSGQTGNTPFALFAKTVSVTTAITQTNTSTNNDMFGRCNAVLVLSGSSGVIGQGALDVGAISVSGTGVNGNTGTAALSIGVFAASGAGASTVTGESGGLAISLVASGTSNPVVDGAATLNIADLLVAGDGYLSVPGAAALSVGLVAAGSGYPGDEPPEEMAPAFIGSPAGYRVKSLATATINGRRITGPVEFVKRAIEEAAIADASRRKPAKSRRAAKAAAYAAAQDLREQLRVEDVALAGIDIPDMRAARQVMARELQRAYQQAHQRAAVVQHVQAQAAQQQQRAFIDQQNQIAAREAERILLEYGW